jgi:hypothetical protein
MGTSPTRGRAHAVREVGIAALTRLWSYSIISAAIAVGVGRAAGSLVDTTTGNVFGAGMFVVVASALGLSYPAVRDRLGGRA